MPVEEYSGWLAWCDECDWQDQGYASRGEADDALENHIGDKH